MLLLQSRGWALNNRNINMAGQAMGNLLAKALGPQGTVIPNSDRNTDELDMAFNSTGYFEPLPNEPYNRELMQPKIDAREKQRASMYKPESLEALHYIVNNPDMDNKSKAKYKAMMDKRDLIAYEEWYNLENPKAEKVEENKPLWQRQKPDKDQENIWEKNTNTGELREVEVEGKKIPNTFNWDPVDRIWREDGVEYIKYKDGSQTQTRYRDNKTGKYEPEVLKGLKNNARRLSGAGLALRAMKDPRKEDTSQYVLSSQRKAYEKRVEEYENMSEAYISKKRLLENEIKYKIDDPNDLELVEKLVKEVRSAGGPDMDGTGMWKSRQSKQDKIDYFYDQLRDNIDEFENPHVLELIMMAYHEILFEEPYYVSNDARRMKERIQNSRGY